jgi:hypothetical protein
MQHRIEMVPAGQIEPAKRNPKRHDIDGLVASMREHGFVEPGVRNESTGRTVAGHGRKEFELERYWGVDLKPKRFSLDKVKARVYIYSYGHKGRGGTT